LQSALGSMKQKRDKHAVKAQNLQGQLDALDGRVDAEAQFQIAAIAAEWEAAEQNQTEQSVAAVRLDARDRGGGGGGTGKLQQHVGGDGGDARRGTRRATRRGTNRPTSAATGAPSP
jgi:hypothetical protein